MSGEVWRLYQPSTLASLVNCTHRRGDCCRLPMPPTGCRGRQPRVSTAEVAAIYPSVRWSAFDWIDDLFDTPARFGRLLDSLARASRNHPLTDEHRAGCSTCQEIP